jgi:hypothetical protein
MTEKKINTNDGKPGRTESKEPVKKGRTETAEPVKPKK